MKTINVESWEELVLQLNQLAVIRDELSETHLGNVSRFLYRGQSSHQWKLETTLERVTDRDWSIANYAHLVSAAKPAVESYTGKEWIVPEFPVVEEWANKYENLGMGSFPGYEFIAYLRHHGFPSPLLDWSKSPYVAAFFAFEQADEQDANGRVALFAYLEYAGGGKSEGSGVPQIRSLGPYIKTHQRHFRQQSQYTVCAEYVHGHWRYAFHEDVFQREDGEQDRLWKITMPASEKIKVLKYLDDFNLNAYSLYQTEESLLKMIALRELKFSTSFSQ